MRERERVIFLFFQTHVSVEWGGHRCVSQGVLKVFLYFVFFFLFLVFFKVPERERKENNF